MTAMSGIDVKLLQPALGNGLQTIEGTGNHTGNGTGGVGVSSPVNRLQQAILKVVGIEK